MPGPVSESYPGPSDPPIRTADDLVDVLLELVSGGLLEGVFDVDEVSGGDDRRSSIVINLDDEQQVKIHVSLAASLEVSGPPGAACRCADVVAGDPRLHLDGCPGRSEFSSFEVRAVQSGAPTRSPVRSPARVDSIRTVDDLVGALGDLVEDGAFAGVLGLDDDGRIGGKRLLAVVLNDDDQSRIRFSLSTSPDDDDTPGVSGAACRCAEVVIEYPGEPPRRVSTLRVGGAARGGHAGGLSVE